MVASDRSPETRSVWFAMSANGLGPVAVPFGGHEAREGTPVIAERRGTVEFGGNVLLWGDCWSPTD